MILYLSNVDSHAIGTILVGWWEQGQHREVNSLGTAASVVQGYEELVSYGTLGRVGLECYLDLRPGRL